ncbi:10429_t:CDS:2 [Acaulospora morrowiae]|uniref:10429_t:CDS:1 n=1 Tax=Acaulospora morrowiae TaxID=94023 RepID=A0A9N9DE66_9GLOM|nr:10429_t:CDS:2 [Acaulospora morrowiae]
MLTGGLPEETLKKVQYREYWEEPHSKWGNIDTWDHYFIEKDTRCNEHKSHNALGAELKGQYFYETANVLHPVLLVWGRRALSLMYTMTCVLCCVLRPTLLAYGRRVSGLYITAACIFCFSWESYPATAGRVEVNFGPRWEASHNLKNGKHLEDPPAYDTIQSHNIEDEVSNSQTHPTVEEPIFDTHIATLLLQYRRVLEEMRNHYVEQESQRGRHLSNMLKWSVVDHSLFNGFKFVVSLLRPAINMSLLEPILMESRNKPIHHVVTILRNLITKEIVDDISPGFKKMARKIMESPGSKPSENHIKSQMWAKIFSDTFLIDSDDIDVNWEYHHQIPGNGGSGSSRSDIATVVFNDTDQQFPFFIAEFETDGFSVHKDEMVVAAEATFEYNRILTAAYYLSEDEVNSSRLHIGLINGTTIHLGSMKPIYDEEKKSLIYAYEVKPIMHY